MSPRWRRFRKGPDGTLIVSLAPEELGLLARISPTSCAAVFEAPPEDPAAQRLFPQAHLDPTEEEAEEWTAMVHPDLLRQRLDALELVTGSLGRATENKEWREIALTPDDVQAWLGVFNDTRLVLGTRLGVTEDEPDIDPDAPDGAELRGLLLAHPPAGRPDRHAAVSAVASARRAVSGVGRLRHDQRRRSRPILTGRDRRHRRPPAAALRLVERPGAADAAPRLVTAIRPRRHLRRPASGLRPGPGATPVRGYRALARAAWRSRRSSSASCGSSGSARSSR